MNNLQNDEALELLKNSELIYTAEQVQVAVSHIANNLNAIFNPAKSLSLPLVLCVMGGATVFTGQLLPKLSFPLEFDFIHVSRYGNDKNGSEIIWKVIPRQDVQNRTIIVLDDILDEGQTLAAIKQKLLDMGAAQVILAVFADKDNGLDKPVKADYVGLVVPNKFVIGFGMDAGGYWRNLPEIRAIQKTG